MGIDFQTGLGIGVMAFFAEFIDSSLGMGYGTTLTPLLMLIFGFEPLQIVPAVLLSELVTGVLAGFTHHSMGNVNFRPQTMSLTRIFSGLKRSGGVDAITHGLPVHLQIVMALALAGVLGTVISVFIAISIPKFWLKLYIGVLVVTIGVVILGTLKRDFGFSWKKIWALGFIASFNKGMSGGGYGPVVTGGQIISGVEGKSAVGITSLSEGLTCLVGVIMYVVLKENTDWRLAPYLVAGGILSVPISAYVVKISKTYWLRAGIGVTTAALGLFTLYRVIVPVLK